MRSAHSFNKGIMIYESKNNQAVCGYYENDMIVIKTGTKKEMLNELSYDQITDRKKKDKILLYVAIIELLIFIFSLFINPLMINISLFIFFVSTYMPILTILFSLFTDHSLSFKRFHGCEHKLLNIEDEITYDKLKNASIYHSECGTIYQCSFIIFMFVFCISLSLIFHIGILSFFRNILITFILLFLNLFNKYNPFFIIQKHIVSVPTDHEYNLVLQINEKYKEVVE